MKPTEVAKALDRNLTSPNERDRNGEPANVVDGLYAIARGLQAVARALTNTQENGEAEGGAA